MNEEQLLEFLYIAPVALIQFDNEGMVKMANPRVAQLFNRYAPGGYFANFYSFLRDFLPDLEKEITSFDDEHGQIMENRRYCINAPTLTGEEELWMDVTVMRQEKDVYIASLNNVTNQVQVEAEKFLAEERLVKVFEAVSQHVIFTMDPSGLIDSWNVTGETYITNSEGALGKILSQILPISLSDNANYLKIASEEGSVRAELEMRDRSGEKQPAEFCISSIHDQKDAIRGFSVVLTIGN